MIDLKKSDEFEFFVPISFIAKSASSDIKDTRRCIQGIASTDHVDLQDETVVQSGIDTTYFMKYGFINDDHKPGPEHKVGEPIECRSTKAGLWLKAFLYKGQDRAEYWWQFMQALEQSGADRKVGFSIQGKILRRAGNSILKCWLQDVAITASPVNTHSWAEVVKSLSAEKWCVHPWKPLEKACKGCPGNKDCSSSLPTMLKQKEKEDEKKALSAGGMGGSLIPQSLEGGVKVQTYKSIPNQFTLKTAIQFLRKEKGYSAATAETVASAIFVASGIQ